MSASGFGDVGGAGQVIVPPAPDVSATNALASANAASTSATNAAASAASAGTSATNANASATNAASSAAAASTSATAASASQTAAAGSATSAATSATNSANSAIASAASAASAASVLASAVQKTSATGSAMLPAGTTAQRDAVPAVGAMRLNSTIVALESYFAGAWNTVATTANSVLTSTDQVIAGIKTFSSSPVIPAATAAAHAVAASQAINFTKLNTTGISVAFSKTAGTGVQGLTLSCALSVLVNTTLVNVASGAAVALPTLTGGTDYAIYACADGTVRADTSFVNPTGYTTANSRIIGGFHYGLVTSGTTVASGSFATTGNGKIWVQSDVDLIAGINSYSLWDLKFRPKCDPRGMALVGNQVWVDIYLCSTDTATNGTSKAGTNIASGSVLPKIPAAFNGNGTTTYPSLNWWVANELARANGKRLPWEYEFVDAAFGVTENQSVDTVVSTYPTTLRNAGYTSKYGIEQAAGVLWNWGLDSSFLYGAAGGSWKDVNGNTGATGAGRGQVYTTNGSGLVRVLFGGSRAAGAVSGSRASDWNIFPWYSDWSVGLRAVCDHMTSL